jgi:outer membrane cobalamin receptor
MHSFLLAACCLVTGHIHAVTGAPLTAAHVSVHGSTAQAAVSDIDGSFTLTVAPGAYQLDATAKGYVSVSVDLNVTDDSKVEIGLEPLDAPTLRTIGTVRVDGRLAPIRGAIPSITLTRQDMSGLGDTLALQGLQTLPGATFAHPDGGLSSGITAVALRGPDPSESLVALDGQLLNDGNTGDLDLSRIPLSILSSLNVTEGLGPQDSNGSNTFGGAINFISLRPTKDPHFSFSSGGGSWGQSEMWLNATGTKDKLGYAFALDNSQQSGFGSGYQVVYPPGSNPATCACGVPTALGSAVSARAALANLTYSFSQATDITARVFVLGDNRDQSATINGVDSQLVPNSNPPQGVNPTYGDFIGPGAESFAQDLRAYQIRGRTPLGAGELTADLSTSDNNIDINGNPSNPAYDVDHVDHRYNAGFTWQRTFDTSNIAIGGYTRYEDLTFVAPPSSDGSPLTPFEAQPTLGQTINVFFARGGFQPAPKLHLDAGLFESKYTTFGSNLDGRFAAIYNTDPSTAVRFSIGSGFRAPLLFERYQFPLSQLAVDSNGVFVGQGSPGEHPEHATEYELGISHQFASSTLDFSLYQTNLRDPIEIYYPFQLTNPGISAGNPTGASLCLGQTPTAPIPGCVSYQSNVGNAVYQGIEMKFVQSFVPQHLFLTAMYGLNISYPKDLNSFYSNPTFGGGLVDNQQFPGVPQQQGSLELDYADNGFKWATNAIFRGGNNELNQGPFTVFNTGVTFKMNAASDITFSGTNLFNGGVSSRYTLFGAGVPYPGNGGLIPTDRYSIEPFAYHFAFTMHM